MLGNIDAVVTIAVKDLDVAKKFYEGTLGLKQSSPPNPEVLSYKSGNSPVMVYRSQFAGTNEATAATWVVDNVDTVVKELKGKGVAFEHYDMPDMKREGDVHVAGNTRAAWFKDPDNNILSVVQGTSST